MLDEKGDAVSLISYLLPFLVASVVATILETLFCRFGVQKRFLRTGLYLLVIPVIFSLTRDAVPSGMVLLCNSLGLATIVASFWWAKRSEAKVVRTESVGVLAEGESQ